MTNGNRGFLEAPFLYDEIKKVVVQLGIFKLGEDCNRVILYPHFFIMVVEGLVGLMHNAMALGDFQGLQISNDTHFELL